MSNTNKFATTAKTDADPDPEEWCTAPPIDVENFIPNPEQYCHGSVLRFVSQPKDSIMNVHTYAFLDDSFKVGDSIFVLRSYQHKDTGQLVVLFNRGENERLAFVSDADKDAKLESVIEVVVRGTPTPV
jgi:hypothetical protein